MRPNPYIEISFPIRFCFPFSSPSRFVFPFKQNGKGKQREREQKREKTESTKPALSLIFSLSLCRIVLRILGSDMASTMPRNTKEHPTYYYTLTRIQIYSPPASSVSSVCQKCLFGRANKLNSIFLSTCEIAKDTSALSGNSYHTHTHTHTYEYSGLPPGSYYIWFI